jgi:hypothetical protein
MILITLSSDLCRLKAFRKNRHKQPLFCNSVKKLERLLAIVFFKKITDNNPIPPASAPLPHPVTKPHTHSADCAAD